MCIFYRFSQKSRQKKKTRKFRETTKLTTFHNTFILNYGEFQFNTYFLISIYFDLLWTNNSTYYKKRRTQNN